MRCVLKLDVGSINVATEADVKPAKIHFLPDEAKVQVLML